MRTASVNEIKQELIALSPAQLRDLCLRLVKFKKENKELLTYLIFEAHDQQGYIDGVKLEIQAQFETINQSNLYFAKKTIRKILRITNKYIRYTGSKQVEVELLLYFCLTLKASVKGFHKSQTITNLYNNQLKKIKTAIQSMHEDLQFEYYRELDKLAL